MKLDIEVKPGERLMDGNCIASDEECVLAPPYLWVVNSSIVNPRARMRSEGLL